MKCWVWIIVVVLILSLFNTTVIVSSDYRPLITNQGDAAPNMFARHGDIKCVPGPSKDGAYYTDTYGGICNDQQYVHKLGHEYAVTDGIGGSLLAQ
jgi:hypothetical protein